MKKITVYADFDFLSTPQEIGILGYEHVRGKDHFVFEYSREWLKQYGGILLSGDLMNVPSLQHPRGNDNVFGFVKDSFPVSLLPCHCLVLMMEPEAALAMAIWTS